MALPGDDDPETAHFGARTADGQLVGTGSVRRESPGWDHERADAWRLRGMATEPDLRGEGIGGAVLAAVFDHVRHHGGGLLWCHARLPALEFYRRAGLVTWGEPWVDPEIGPHIVMWREVAGC